MKRLTAENLQESLKYVRSNKRSWNTQPIRSKSDIENVLADPYDFSIKEFSSVSDYDAVCEQAMHLSYALHVALRLLDEETEACADLAERLEHSDNHEIAFAIRLRKNKS